jgi:hypothetical protein
MYVLDGVLVKRLAFGDAAERVVVGFRVVYDLVNLAHILTANGHLILKQQLRFNAR